MSDKWQWVEGGCKFGEEMRGFAPITDEQFAGFAQDINLVLDMRGIINAARLAFAAGSAEYDRCAERLGDLLTGRRDVEMSWLDAQDAVAARFQPRIDLAAFSDEERVRFATETTLQLAKHLDAKRAKKD